VTRFSFIYTDDRPHWRDVDVAAQHLHDVGDALGELAQFLPDEHRPLVSIAQEHVQATRRLLDVTAGRMRREVADAEVEEVG